MTTTRTKPVITITILLALLALISVVSLVTSLLGGPGGRRPQGAFNGTPGPGNVQGGGGFQGGNNGGAQGDNGGAGNAGGFRGGNGGGGNFRGGGGAFAIFGAVRQLGIDPRIFGYIGTGLSVIFILLTLWCTFGIWKQKKKALNWALVLAILFLLPALPALFFGGGFNVLRLVMNILQVGAAAVIIGMSVLPSVRDSFE